MTVFVTVTPDGRDSAVRIINQADIARCPHYIFAAEHYRPDGTCLCNDPNAKVMREWGYRWNAKRKVWVSA